MNAPCNPQAERAVIAALMRDPDARKIIDLKIAADLFDLEATREAFSAIHALILEGTRPDAATLRASVSDSTLIEIETSMAGNASAANLAAHVRLLKSARQVRQVRAARDRITRAVAAGDPPGELATLVEKLREAEQGDPISRVRFCDTSKLRDATLPPPHFLAHPILPRDQVTLFGGHGGSGKTLLGYVLCAHVATGTDWAGMRIFPGKVLVVSFEDPEGLMLWRFRNIADEYGLDIEKIIRNVKMIDATGAETIMREVNYHGIKDVELTKDGNALIEIISREKFDLVQIDNASDAFDGEENNRHQVRRFIRCLADAIRIHHGALLLLAHIDKTAARYGASGNSYSGSTAWHNSVRSRLALVDNELRQEKLNVGKRLDAGIKLRFSTRGVPVPDDGSGHDEEAAGRNAADDAALLACFRAAEQAGATVPTGERGSNTTWHALSPYPELPKALHADKDRFRQSIARLARDGKITRETYRDGRRHAAERYVLPDARLCASFKTGAEVAQPPQSPIPPMRDFCIGGVGEFARAQTAQDSKLAQTPKGNGGNPDGNGGDPAPDPLARRIQELIAEGWAPSNARAKALTEAREAAP